MLFDLFYYFNESCEENIFPPSEAKGQTTEWYL